MGSPSYVAQRLWQAVDSLGEPRPAETREHLTHALQQLVFLNGEDFDDADDRAAFESLMARASAICVVDQDGQVTSLTENGTIADSVQLLPEGELQAVVQELRRLHQRYPFPSE